MENKLGETEHVVERERVRAGCTIESQDEGQPVEGAKVSQEQEIEELRGEVALLKTKLRGVERMSRRPIAREPTLSIVPPSLASPITPSVAVSSPRVTSTEASPKGMTSVPPASVVPYTHVTSEVGSSSTRAATATASASTAVSLSMSVSAGASLPTSLTASAVVPGTTSTSAIAATATPFLLPTSYMTSPASMLNQLPQIPCFTGEETSDGETFQDWLEQFESIAVLGGWSEHAKLVNLTARLRGGAYSFFRSCSPEQRSSYPLLVAELKKRFTPVKLTAIQTQLFHDRVQGAKESVDEFAQALRQLFSKAYVEDQKQTVWVRWCWRISSSLDYART